MIRNGGSRHQAELSRVAELATRRRASGIFLLGLFGALSVLPFPLWAENPTGASVVAGTAAITQNGNTLNIANSNGAIINWQTFSIGAGNTTQFLQPSAASAVLNRVVGGNLSTIYGTLQSNGQVFLINPNGVLVGAGGMVNTAGFTASTLDVSDAAFRQYAGGGGQLQFLGDSGAKVENLGTIRSDTGNVFLIARQVNNAGTISAPHGTAGLYASSEVYLTTGQADKGSVLVTADALPGGRLDTGVSNSGLISAVQAELKATGNMYGLAVNNTGKVRAVGGTVGQNGVVHFTATGGTIQNSGTIVARNGNGGGGEVKLQAGAGGTVLDDGTIDARGRKPGTTGGTVELTADAVAVYDHAVIDASGPAGGGTVLIGGDAHGANPEVYDAQETYVGPDVVVKADATDSGDGGKVVVWSDDVTAFEGSLSARGGPNGGNGGWVETSGHVLDASGTVTTLAPEGRTGTWLLDPVNVYIAASQADATTAGMVGIDSSISLLGGLFSLNLSLGDTLLTTVSLATALSSSNVTVTTSSILGTGAGDIVVVDALSWGGANSLTLTATDAVKVNAAISNTGGASLALNAPTAYLNAPISLSGGSGTLTGTATTVNLGAGGRVQNGVDAAANGGTVNLAAATYTLSAPVLIQKNLTLHGAGVANTILDGNNATRVITVDGATPLGAGTLSAAPTVELDNFTVQNGKDATNQGGGISSTEANLNLLNMLVQHNAGGGVYLNSFYFQQGPVTVNGNSTSIVGSSINNNTSGADGAGISVNAGGSGSHTLTVTSSQVSGNTSAGGGGGIAAETSNGGSVSVTLGSIDVLNNNTASGGPGGAVYSAVGNGGGNTVNLNGASFSGNTASSGNGAVYMQGGTLNMTGASGLTVAAGLIDGTGTTTFNFTATTGNITMADALSGANFTVTFNAPGTIADTAALNVGTFELVGGTWQQIAASLPAFSAHNFMIDAGTFERFTGGSGAAGSPYQIVDVYGLQGIGSSGMTGLSYILENAINASGTSSWSGLNQGFTPIGTTGTPFTGTLDGNGYVISGLFIYRPSSAYTGMFGVIGATGKVQNVGVTGASLSGTSYMGVLAADNLGTIQNSYASGTIFSDGGSYVGGLVGYNGVGSLVQNTYAGTNVTTDLSVSGPIYSTGGLVGENHGTVEDSYVTGTVTVAGNVQNVGGVVGDNYSGSVHDIYFTGTVSGDASTTYVGGLVGKNDSGSSLANGYVTGAVSGGAAVGGVVGYNVSGSAVTGTYYASDPYTGTVPGGIGSGSGSAVELTVVGMETAFDSSGYYVANNMTGLNTTPGSGPWAIAGVTAGGVVVNGGLPYFQWQYPTLAITASGQSVSYGSGISSTGVLGTTYTVVGSGSVSTYLSGGTVTLLRIGGNVNAGTTNGIVSAGTVNSGYAVEFFNGTETITKAPVVVTALGGTSTYGDSPLNPGLSASGLVNGDTLGSLGGLSNSFGINSGTGVGSYALNVLGTLANPNYTLTAVAGSWVIDPAVLTYAANAASRTYGASDPTYTGTVTGMVNGETLSEATTGTLSFTPSATASSNVGTYGLTGGGLSAANYTFVQAAGNATALAIDPAVLTYTADAASRTYGASDPAYTGTVTGFVLGQDLASATTGSAAFSTSATASSNVGAYALTGGGLTANNGNYTFVQAAGNAAALTIDPAVLTYTADAASRTYGASNPAYTGTVTGFVLGQTLATATTGSAAFTTPATAASGVGHYGITGSGLTANDGNYTFVQAAGNAAALEINPATLVISLAGTAGKVYDGTTAAALAAGNYQLSGLVNGDTLALTGGSASYAAANVGTGIAVSASGLALSGGAAANYVLASSTATGNIGVITPASLVLAASDESKVALNILSFAGTEFTATGLQNGETVQSTALASDGASFNALAGSYGIRISGGVGGNGFRLSNYSVRYVDGTLTVTPAAAAAVLPTIVTQVSATTTQATATPAAATVALTTDTAGAAGGTDKTVGTGSNGDPDTGSGTGSGKKSATLGTTTAVAATTTTSAPANETVALPGAAGSIGMHGITASLPPPPVVVANFNKVLSPAVMSQLKQALQ